MDVHIKVTGRAGSGKNVLCLAVAKALSGFGLKVGVEIGVGYPELEDEMLRALAARGVRVFVEVIELTGDLEKDRHALLSE